MIEINGLAELRAFEGKVLGPSNYMTVTQQMIDDFARVTGDDQWIHCDPERAAKESPFGKTIAHGYLTLSLFVALQNDIYTLSGVSRAINYGANKLRFISPVPVDSKVRIVQLIKAIEPIAGGVRLSTESTFEIEGVEKPALIIETIGLLFE